MAETKVRAKVAEREYLDAKGNVTEDEHEATGVRYTHLGTGKVIEFQIPSNRGKDLLAAFGLKTWIGNLMSQHDGDVAAVQAKLDQVAAGNWPERVGGFGPRYDVDALVTAIASATADAGLPSDEGAIRKRIADEKGYAAGALKNPAVLAHYNSLTQKATDLGAL